MGSEGKHIIWQLPHSRAGTSSFDRDYLTAQLTQDFRPAQLGATTKLSWPASHRQRRGRWRVRGWGGCPSSPECLGI